MGNKRILSKEKVTDTWNRYDHWDGSTTDEHKFRYGNTYTHHDHETGEEYTATRLNYGNLAKDSGQLFIGFLALPFLVFALIGLWELRNSAYTMIAAPAIIYHLALGEGLGWIALAVFIVPSIVFAIISHFTEKAGHVLSMLWAFLLGIGVIVYQAAIVQDPLYILDTVVLDNFTEVISLYIGTVIHVFMFTMAIQCITILFSFDAAHIGMYWRTFTLIFLVLSIIILVCQAFGVGAFAGGTYYEAIDPICNGLGLTAESMQPTLQWAGLAASIATGPLGIILILCVWGICKLCKKSLQNDR